MEGIRLRRRRSGSAACEELPVKALAAAHCEEGDRCRSRAKETDVRHLERISASRHGSNDAVLRGSVHKELPRARDATPHPTGVGRAQRPKSRRSSTAEGRRQDHRRTPSRVHECVQLKRVGYQRRFSQHAGVRAERLDGPDVGKPKPKPDPKGQDRPNAPSNGVSPKAG